MRFLGASFASVLGATLFILVILRMQIDGCPSVKLPCDRVAHPLFDWSANACRCVQVITAFKISRGLGRGSFYSFYYLLCVLFTSAYLIVTTLNNRDYYSSDADLARLWIVG